MSTVDKAERSKWLASPSYYFTQSNLSTLTRRNTGARLSSKDHKIDDVTSVGDEMFTVKLCSSENKPVLYIYIYMYIVQSLKLVSQMHEHDRVASDTLCLTLT